MLVKNISDGASPLVGNQILYKNKEIKLDSQFKDNLKDVAKDREILIRNKNKWVNVNKHFDDKKSTTVKADIKVKDENSKEEADVADDFSSIFEGHWKTQVKNAKEVIETEEDFDRVVNYAEDNDVSNTVLKKVKEYREEL